MARPLPLLSPVPFAPLRGGVWRASRRRRGPTAGRRRLAAGLERAVADARRPAAVLTATIPVAPEAAGAARAPLLALAARLRDAGPVRPEGLALARRLLTDGAGPLYVPRAPGTLRDAAARALATLDEPDGGGRASD